MTSSGPTKPGGELFKIEILPLGEREFPAVLKLVKDVFNAADREKAAHELAIHMKARKARVEYGHEYWAAKAGRRVVGIIGLEHVGNGAAWLSWFAVSKKYRGKGIGWELFTFVMEKARKKGVRSLSIQCGTLPMFRTANKLYDEFGFKDKFKVKNFWAAGDDLLVKSKKLRA